MFYAKIIQNKINKIFIVWDNRSKSTKQSEETKKKKKKSKIDHEREIASHTEEIFSSPYV